MRFRLDTLYWAVFLAMVAVLNVLVAGLLLREGLRVLAMLYAWSAASLFAVVGLYLQVVRGSNPGPVLKGWRHPWLQPLLLPFRAVSLLVWAVARRLRREPFTAVSEGLWLGARPFSHEAEVLRAQGVGAVLDLVSELPSGEVFGREPFARRVVPLLDRTMPTEPEFDDAVAWAVGQLTEGRGLLVHCAFGRGRSALLTAAIVYARGLAPSAEGALAVVSRARPFVRLRPDQREALERFTARWSLRGAQALGPP
ncbi:MAG: dual specificity protein phosphatase family protein [Deltaproteobacteria bacterium]|nr:dual specificity protein phosphatase family protein [Deltaproteobacteria bacterium]